MMVTLAVVGLLYVIVSQALDLGMRAGARQALLRADSRALADGWQVARRALAGLDPGSAAQPTLLSASGDGVAFNTVLAWISPYPVAASLRVDARHRLVLRWAARDGGGGEEVLAGEVAALSIGYRDAGATGGWRDSWSEPRLPGMIRLSLSWRDPARRPWPPIVAGPALTAPRT